MKVFAKEVKKILEVFPKTPPPPFEEVTGHRCPECNALRDDFNGVKWWEAEHTLIDENFGKLPLFTPRAFHYYIPAFILRSLEKFNPYDEVLEFVIYSLYPSEKIADLEWFEQRKELFSEQQISIIVQFLNSVLLDTNMQINYSDAEKALTFWS